MATQQTASTGANPEIAPPTPSVQTAAIRLLNGPNAGKQLELTKAQTTLGKPGVQVAIIAQRPDGYYLSHIEGARFPSLNGQVLDAQAYLLADQDVVEIAGVKMVFFEGGGRCGLGSSL